MTSNKSSYKKRKYSGGVNRRRVAAQLKRYHGEGKSRLAVWGQVRSSQPQEIKLEQSVSEAAKPKQLKTYKKPEPAVHIDTKIMCGNLNPTVTTEPAVDIDSNITCGSLNPTVTTEPAIHIDTNITCGSLNPTVATEPAVHIDTKITCGSLNPTVTTEPTFNCNINCLPCEPSVEEHKPQVDVVPSDRLSGLTGYRIVDLKHVLQWAFDIERHRQSCFGATIDLVSEQRHGLECTLTFKCNSCGKHWINSSEAAPKINKSFVSGSVTADSSYIQTDHMMSIMDIPNMSAPTFQEMEKHLGSVWLQHITEEIKQAGEQEKAIATAIGNIGDDGVPFITVCVNGGWPKRTNDHNYNSASGMACIIGQETKKCLYLGVKNIYCFYCQFYEKKSQDIPFHQCFKNFIGPTTSMENAILVDGFQKSQEIHDPEQLS